MKRKYLLLTLAFFIGLLIGCKPNKTQTPTNQLLKTPSVTLTPSRTQTPTITSVPTLSYEEAQKTIQKWFETISDCAAPCFWGITPYKTTLDEARSIFAYLRLQITKDYTVNYFTGNGLSGMISLDVNNNLVRSASMSIKINDVQEETSHTWLAYSPESLIARYGIPSKVEIIGRYVMDRIVFSESPKWYSIYIYFASQNLIVAYEDGEFKMKASPYLACPLKNKFSYVKLWFGENPKHPPGPVYSIEEVSNLNLEKFAALILKEVDSACFNLNENIFN